VTEKILHAFAAAHRARVLGRQRREADFNPEAFVNCHPLRVVRRGVSRERSSGTTRTRRVLPDAGAAAASRWTPKSPRLEEEREFRAGWPRFSAGPGFGYRRNRLFWGKKYNRDLEIAFFEPHCSSCRRLKRLLK
jgi:hypothetical protein